MNHAVETNTAWVSSQSITFYGFAWVEAPYIGPTIINKSKLILVIQRLGRMNPQHPTFVPQLFFLSLLTVGNSFGYKFELPDVLGSLYWYCFLDLSVSSMNRQNSSHK